MTQTALVLLALLDAPMTGGAQFVLAAIAGVAPALLSSRGGGAWQAEFVAARSRLLAEKSHHRAPFPAVWPGAAAMQQPSDHVGYLVGDGLGDKLICLQPGHAKVVTNGDRTVGLVAHLAGAFAAQIVTHIDPGNDPCLPMQQRGGALQPLPGGFLQCIAQSLGHDAGQRGRQPISSIG